MEFLKIIAQIIGHIAWPVALILIAYGFKKEISLLLGRIKQARYKGVELDLETEFKEVKQEAYDAEITVLYPESSFSKEYFDAINEAPEWVFIKSWQEIEQLIIEAQEQIPELSTKTKSISRTLSSLVEYSVITKELGILIKNMYEIRNKIVHSYNAEFTRGELIEWLGLARSLKDRLRLHINNYIKKQSAKPGV